YTLQQARFNRDLNQKCYWFLEDRIKYIQAFRHWDAKTLDQLLAIQADLGWRYNAWDALGDCLEYAGEDWPYVTIRSLLSDNQFYHGLMPDPVPPCIVQDRD